MFIQKDSLRQIDEVAEVTVKATGTFKKDSEEPMSLKGPGEVNYHTVVCVTWLMGFSGAGRVGVVVVVIDLNPNGTAIY